MFERSQARRRRLTRFDRLLWVWFSRFWCHWRTALVIVKPDTVIAWQRRGFRLFWTWKSRRRTGRPTVPHEVRALIRTMSVANPLHAQQLIAADFFVVPTATCRLLFVLVLLAHDRRRIVRIAVTEHPTAAWTAQQFRDAFPWDEAPRYLLRDRDHAFDHVKTIGMQEVLTAPGSPGRTPTSNDSSDRSDASASITSSC